MAEEKQIPFEKLYQMYVKEKMSARQIAKEFNVTHGIILTKLRKMGVLIRPFNDKQYYNLENGRKNYKISPSSNKRKYVCIMEDAIGRKLTADEVVHHIDFNRKNNDVSNLFLFENANLHHAYHAYIKNHDYIAPSAFIETFGNIYKTVLTMEYLYYHYIILEESANQIAKNNYPISRLLITKTLKKLHIWEKRPPSIN